VAWSNLRTLLSAAEMLHIPHSEHDVTAADEADVLSPLSRPPLAKQRAKCSSAHCVSLPSASGFSLHRRTSEARVRCIQYT
jgi:hypothetical protein